MTGFLNFLSICYFTLYFLKTLCIHYHFQPCFLTRSYTESVTESYGVLELLSVLSVLLSAHSVQLRGYFFLFDFCLFTLVFYLYSHQLSNLHKILTIDPGEGYAMIVP